MSTIQINYDLVAPGRNYQPVYNYIKSHGTWARPLQSLWLIRTNKTAATVRNELNRLVDRNDKVATFDVTNDDWATNFVDDTTNWMHGHMAAVNLFGRAA